MDNFKKYPYTCLKARVYIEVSAFLVASLQYTSIKANHLTLIYALLGPISILLMYLGSDISYTFALLNFVLFKGFIDWSDGALARVKDNSTELGALLDVWGAYVNSVSFHVCIAIFLHNQTNLSIYLYSCIAIVFIKAIDIKQFSHAFWGRAFIDGEEVKGQSDNKSTVKVEVEKESALIKLYKIFTWILDERARMVDSLIGLLFIEYIYFDNSIIAQIIFFLITTGVLVRFVAGLYVVLLNKKYELPG